MCPTTRVECYFAGFDAMATEAPDTPRIGPKVLKIVWNAANWPFENAARKNARRGGYRGPITPSTGRHAARSSVLRRCPSQDEAQFLRPQIDPSSWITPACSGPHRCARAGRTLRRCRRAAGKSAVLAGYQSLPFAELCFLSLATLDVYVMPICPTNQHHDAAQEERERAGRLDE